jgi:hypothetical protein
VVTTSASNACTRRAPKHESDGRYAAWIAVRAFLIVLGLATIVAVGCGQSDGTGSSCAAAVRWNQTLYFGHALKAARGGVLGRGVVPACEADGEDQRVTIRRVANVPAALAVALDGVPGPAGTYLAPGFFPILADHPLHRALERQAGSLPRPRGCSARFRLAGTVLRTPLTDGVSLASAGRKLSVTVVPNTRIVGFRRAGYAYLQRRDLVEVVGRRCDLPDSEDAYLADVIAPAR